MKKGLLTLSALFLGGFAFSQVILSENFESTTGTSIPGTWTQTTVSTDGGFKSGTATSLSSTSFPIPTSNGTRMLATNDDACNCDKSADRLISPSMDFTGYSNIALSADLFYVAGSYQGDTESAKLEVSTDNGATWTTLQTIPGVTTGWSSLAQDLTAYAGNSNVKVSIIYNDNGGWLFGLVLDNFVVKQPSPNDAILLGASLNRYSLISTNNTVAFTIKNDGSNAITSVDLTWNDGTAHTATVSCNIAPGATATVNHSTAVNFATIVEKNIAVSVAMVNGAADPNMGNNTAPNKLFNTISANSTKNVVIEEGTGTWCGWCPRGAVAMEYMDNTYPDHFIGIAVHNGDPMTVSAYDAGANFSGFPGSNVDRALLDQSVSNDDFENYYNARKDIIVPASVDATATGSGATLGVDVSATFHTVFAAANYRLGVVLTENGVTGTGSTWDQHNYYSASNQNLPLNGAGHDWQASPDPIPAAQMVYNHVGRALLGGYAGQSGSVPASITDGQTVTYSFTYTIPSGMNRANMHAVALLIDNNTGEIINAKQIAISGAGIEEASTIEMNVYPNPASSEVNVAFKGEGNYTVHLTDMAGKLISTQEISNVNGSHVATINTSNVVAGSYLVTIANGNGSFTQNVIIK